MRGDWGNNTVSVFVGKDAEDQVPRVRGEFDRRVGLAYESARAVNAGTGGGLDDVIDPAETREWIAMGLKRVPPVVPRTGKKHPYIDTW